MCCNLNLAFNVFSSEISHLVSSFSSATFCVDQGNKVVYGMVIVFTCHPPLAQRQYTGGQRCKRDILLCMRFLVGFL